MKPRRWPERISLIVALALAFQAIGLPVALAGPDHLLAEQIAWAIPAPAPVGVSGASGDPLVGLLAGAYAAPFAPLRHSLVSPGLRYEGESPCVPDGSAEADVSYPERRLRLCQILGRTGPHLLLRYDSRPEAGVVGANWWHNYEVSLQVIDEERVLLTAYGQAQLFEGKQGKYASATERGHTLTRVADGTWRWMRSGADGAPIQGVMTLDGTGRATLWKEPSGRSLSFDYDDAGQLTSITDQSGRSTSLVYADGRLAGVTDAAGSTWTLAYTDDDLVASVDPLGAAWALSYDDAHRLTAKTDPLGFKTTYGYDATGRLAEIIDPGGHRVTFETEMNATPHAPANGQVAAPALGTTIVKHISAGGVTTSQHRYTYDENGRVVRTVTSPDNGATAYVWEGVWGQGDNAGLLLSEIDASGLTTTYSYRSGTALVEKVSAPPLPDVAFGYRQVSGYWVITSRKVGDQATQHWRYDARGRHTGVEQGGLRWFYSYEDTSNAYGQPSAMVWNWNGQGDPARTSSARIVRYGYNDLGQLVGVEDSAGAETRYGYDGAGRLVSITDALDRTRTIAYDAAGRIARQADARGGQTVYTFDAAGRVTAVTDAEGSTTTYTYDSAGRVTGVTDPLGRTARWVYGGEGELLSHTDARGDTVTVTNDALGRPLALAYPNGETWRLTYDATGNVTSLAGDGLTRTVQRDVAGRVLQLADIGAGRATWVSYAYNASGQVSESRTSEGSVTTYAYGNLGELKRISGPLGATDYAYESADQRAPRRVAVRSGPLRTALTYDASGRLAAIRHYQQGHRDGVDRTTRYTYDAVGNTVSMETPEGTSTYAYDELDRLVAYTGTDGILISYAYDAVGNRTSLAVEGGETIDYLYDAAHQLLQAGDTGYAYDRNGRLISEVRPDGLRTYAWDYLGRLVQVAERAPCALPYPLGPVATAQEAVAAYRYAPAGERVQTVRADNARETTRYDGHVVATLDEAGRVLEARQRGAGWDEWTTVAVSLDEAGGEPSARYLLTDAQGSVVGAVDEAGALVFQAAFDPWGLPEAVAGVDLADGQIALGFRGQPFEAETGLYDLGGRWYDPVTGRFISPDQADSACGQNSVNRYLVGMNNPLCMALSGVEALLPEGAASPAQAQGPRDCLPWLTGCGFPAPLAAGGCEGIAAPLKQSMREGARLSCWR